MIAGPNKTGVGCKREPVTRLFDELFGPAVIIVFLTADPDKNIDPEPQTLLEKGF